MSEEGTIAVAADAVATIVRHARAEAPYECCGLLLGEADAVQAVVPARNIMRSRSRYRVHPPAKGIDLNFIPRPAILAMIGIANAVTK